MIDVLRLLLLLLLRLHDVVHRLLRAWLSPCSFASRGAAEVHRRLDPHAAGPLHRVDIDTRNVRCWRRHCALLLLL